MILSDNSLDHLLETGTEIGKSWMKGIAGDTEIALRFLPSAYTVELEAELNQLKEENTLLQQALAEADFERKRKQQYLEELKMKTQTKAEKAKEKLKKMRKTWSCPL
ncbi:Protein abscisic acid-insensitive 5 [Vitis vinifera]|uniref:Protein abscisic acid-insensitive 5 n=1 Tax=Vitis vinifera TaxID=29760 RepID=A0A438EKB1_VITVI|nr:Protein abscisic acid-insensitive 5 [Vitis vinifera]